LFYFHNLMKFDSFFLIQWCCFYDKKIKLISRDNILYKITIFIGNKELHFVDSYNLFPEKLNVFVSSMGGISNKIEFNHNIKEYNSEILEQLKVYCLNDSSILFEALSAYRNYIFSFFNLDITRCLTLAAITLKIFQINYYNVNENPLEKIEGNKDAFCRLSYFGGISDVYKPVMTEGFCYDVNSLYPYVMKTYEFPIGKGKWVSSENINLDSFFGFLKIDIVCPDDIYIPILPIRNKNGVFSKCGKISGVFFSEEIKLALKYGYRILKVYKGLAYEKGNPFINFVHDLYNKRIENKNSPLQKIFKLLLNSLYGKFGMNPKFNITDILLDDKKIQDIIRFHEVKSFNHIQDTKSQRINYNPDVSRDKISLFLSSGMITSEYLENYMNNLEKVFSLQFSCVHIASAITSYARIYMYEKKINCNLYYSDTDSLFTTNELNTSNEIGGLKLEYRIKEALFIAPKLYYIKTNDNLEYIKSKGIMSHSLDKDQFNELLKEKSLFLNIKHNFVRNIKDYSIKSQSNLIEISGDFLKRKKIYDSNNLWVDTKPLKTE